MEESRGAFVNEHRISLLYAAVERGDLHEATQLVNQTIDLNNRSQGKRWTVLSVAVMKENACCVQLLLDYGADPNIPSDGGTTPLHHAVEQKRIDLIETLLNHGANPLAKDELGGNSPVLLACDTDLTVAIRLFMQYSFSMEEFFSHCNYDGHTPLLRAAMKGNANAINLLLQSGAKLHDVDHNRWNLLHFLAYSGCNIDFLGPFSKDLHSIINEFSREGLTPLHISLQRGFCETSFALITYGADVNKGTAIVTQTSRGASTLHLAAMSGQKKLIEILHKEGLYLDVKDRSGSTPLHYAVSRGREEAAMTLISLGCNPFCFNHKGLSAFSCPIDVGSTRLSNEINSKSACLNRFHGEFLSQMQELMHDKTTCDVVLKTEDGAMVHAHKLILCARSPVLRALLSNAFAEKSNETILLHSVNSHGLSVFLEYLYGKDAEIPPELALQLLCASDFYQLKQLRAECCSVLESILRDADVSLCDCLSTYEALRGFHGVERLKELCLSVIIRNIHHSQSFDGVSLDVVNDLVIYSAARWKMLTGQRGESSPQDITVYHE